MEQKSAKTVQAVSTFFKTPPHSTEAERCLLGALMIENSRWESISELVIAEDFYFREHQLVFAAIHELAEKNTSFDAIIVSEKLRNSGNLDEVGKLEYLGELTLAVATAHDIVSYAAIVREKSLLRRLITEITNIAQTAYQPGALTGDEVIDEAEARIFSIAETRPKQEGPQRASAYAASVVQQLEEYYLKGVEVTGLHTGFEDLDKITTGLHKGELVVVAGRPSMGKTSFAMNLVEASTIHEKKAVLVFSLEMSADQLVTRMMSSLGNIQQQALRTGQMKEKDWQKVNDVIMQLDAMHLYIDDSQSPSPSDLRSRSRRVAKQLPKGVELGLIMIDYIQLMRIGKQGYLDNRVAEISEITRSLKALAKEMRVPVVALSQLNRSLESRNDKRPQMADLRESGSIEQDADVIMFIYRDEIYNKDTTEKGIAEIIIGKQRNGPIGTIKLGFQGEYTRFINNSNWQLEHASTNITTIGDLGEADG